MKKERTVRQQKNRYRALQYLCVGGEFISILTPFITLGIVNYEQWFTTEEGWKVGLGGALALGLMGITVFMITKKKEGKSEITNGWITFMVGYFAVAFIFVLLGSIINQIASIMLWGGLGLFGACGLDIASKQNKIKADTCKKVLADAKQETLEEKVRKELEEEEKKKASKKGLV